MKGCLNFKKANVVIIPVVDVSITVTNQWTRYSNLVPNSID